MGQSSKFLNLLYLLWVRLAHYIKNYKEIEWPVIGTYIPVSVSFFSLSVSVSGEHWAWEKKEIRYAAETGCMH